MSRTNYNRDDTHLLVTIDGDTTGSEPWQPDNTSGVRTGSCNTATYIPLSTPRTDGQSDGGQCPPGYSYISSGQNPPGYSHGPNGRTNDDDELLVPPAENHNRPRWGMRSSPYQTTLPGYYGQPVVHGQPTANNSTNSNNIILVQPGNSTNTVRVEPLPKNYTVLSVFTSLFCCLPLGLCALFYARDAQTMWLHGHTQEAQRRSRTSMKLNIGGIVIGAILTAVWVTAIVLFIVAVKGGFSSRDSGSGDIYYHPV